ncbi:protein Mis18-beta [Chelmon rostratus]|uniref:protein Mis18-beta n=1 Tax=Chelmon rostratus TaxID=109905 RepID=UPI001BE56BBB|nr:protein Mis18-beta [Chelmon rostratus]
MEFDGSLLMQFIADVKLARETEHKQRMSLHCQQCNTVLGDSLGVCGEIKCMDSIMCLRVTNDVVISDPIESRHKGEMANCIYSPLKCRGCKAAVGKVIHSAPPRLAVVRSIFLLNKANISCYILNSSSMVKASTLTFDLKPVRESINEVRQQFEVMLDQMSHIKSRLANQSGTSQ